MERKLNTLFLFILATAVSAQNTSVSVSCGRSHIVITVPVDLFGNGVLIGAGELSLGSGCGVTAVRQDVLELEHPVFACGAIRKLFPDSIHYRYILHYVPSAADNIIRSSGFSYPIDCFYSRFWNVSSLGLQPTWVPFTSTVVDKKDLEFALEVYDSTWTFPLSDSTYYLGDLINIKASVKRGRHIPLKVYLDECVARPSAESSVKHEVITNYGCLVDGQHSNSHFLPPEEDGNLRFQLDTFVFNGTSSRQIYLICHLKAMPAGSPDHLSKACSYSQATATWSSYEGKDCSCCGSAKGCENKKRKRRQQSQKGQSGEADLSLGPFALRVRRANSPMSNNPSIIKPSFDTSKPLHAIEIPPNQMVNATRRGDIKEDSGLSLPISTATLVIILACAFVLLLSVLGCYCSAKRSHRGYHMKTVGTALAEAGAVAMAPAAVGLSGTFSSGESSAACKRDDGVVAAP